MGRKKTQHLKQRSDGRYVAVYHGKQFMAKTEAEALEARERYKNNEKEGQRPDRTVKSFALEWLPVSRHQVRDSTYNGLAIHMEKLLRQIGNISLRDVSPMDIKAVYSTEYAGLSNSYIKAGKQLFCALFDAAVENGYCRSNPARNRTAQPHRGTSGGHRAITEQERYWIDNLCVNHRAHAAAIVMLYAGLRPQELKALNVDRDVDFEAGTITLSEFVHLENPYTYERTDEGKTPRARRVIPLFPQVRKALSGMHGYVVTRASGGPVNVQSWKTLWRSYQNAMEEAINGVQRRWYGRTKEQRIMKNEGTLPDWVEFSVVPYDLRKSFCTACRSAGVELNTTIHWMGHTDAKMILGVYDEWSEARGKEEAKKLEKWFGNVQSDMQE